MSQVEREKKREERERKGSNSQAKEEELTRVENREWKARMK